MKSLSNRSIGLLALTTVFLAAWSFNSILAQNSRGPDGTGRGYAAGQYSGRQINHARQSSGSVFSYTVPTQSTPNVAARPPVIYRELTRPDVEIIGHNIAAAQEGIKVMKKEYPNDDIQKRVAAIEKHLADASKLQKTAHEECMKESVDGKMLMSCCSDLTKVLDKASTEHAALMHHLDSTAPATVAK